ncbi:MAG: Rossmann-like and DUF2520 domain-containing protein [Bacteroidota bacterium]
MDATSHTSFGFIGAGKVGISLGAYFKSKELDVVGYVSRNPESARKAASITSTSSLTLKELAAKCNMIWITTPDDQIEKAWNELAQSELQGKLICHTSGAKDSSVFSGIAAKGAFGYSVHPMRAFPDITGKIEDLDTTGFTLEGDPTYFQQFQQLFSRLGNKLFIIDRKHKPMYHLANVMATNLILALLSIATEYLSECGPFRDEPLEALMPMVEKNLTNLKHSGFINALTGPVERNDLGTVKKHLEVITPKDSCLYQILTQKLLDLAEKKHPDQDYTYLRQILETGGLN